MRRLIHRALPLLVAGGAAGGVLGIAAVLVPQVRAALPVLLPAAAVVVLVAAAFGYRARRRPPWLGAVSHALDLWQGANPGYRLADDDLPAALGAAFNRVADHFQAQAQQLDERIAGATLSLEQDRALLAALIERMDEAVVVCGADGRVMLYNARLAELLEGEPVIGLGRSLFTVFRRRMVSHFAGRAAAARSAVAGIMTSRSGRHYHVRVCLLDVRPHSGYLISLAPLEAAMPPAIRWSARLQASRQRLEGLTSALGALAGDVDAQDARATGLLQATTAELRDLASDLDELEAASGQAASLPLEDVAAEDLLALLLELIGAGVESGGEAPAAVWVRAEPWSLSLLLGGFVRGFGGSNREQWRLHVATDGERAQLRLRWNGPAVDATGFADWRQRSLTEIDAMATPQQLLAALGGSLVLDARPGGGELVLTLQAGSGAPAIPPAGEVLPSRPESFDFDLFRHDVSGSLAGRPLQQLVLTAMDTETTGLNPSAGDEIIAIGAIRIVNARLLGREVFESLIATDRPIHPDAQRIHGITPDALAGQPGAEAVLRRFGEFSQDSVLLGHNIAFDLRFLELAAQRFRLDFAPASLDTLLLSSLVYPQRHVHSLEDVAGRLGVAVLGRHTALGDAIVTAEVFLRLLPLLRQRGIHTLGDALAASKESWYARLAY